MKFITDRLLTQNMLILHNLINRYDFKIQIDWKSLLVFKWELIKYYLFSFQINQGIEPSLPNRSILHRLATKLSTLKRVLQTESIYFHTGTFRRRCMTKCMDMLLPSVRHPYLDVHRRGTVELTNWAASTSMVNCNEFECKFRWIMLMGFFLCQFCFRSSTARLNATKNCWARSLGSETLWYFPHITGFKWMC